MRSPAGSPTGRPSPRSGFARRIEARMHQLGLSKKDLCLRAALSRQTLANLLQGSSGRSAAHLPSVRTLLCLANALQVHPYWLTDAFCADQRLSLHLSARQQGDRAGFVRDASVPDGCAVAPGARFFKTWVAQNLGHAAWAGRRLVCWDAHLQAQAQALHGGPAAPPRRLRPDAESIDLGVLAQQASLDEGGVFAATMGFTAPNEPGPAVSYWLAVEADGRPCYSESAGLAAIVHVVPEPERRAAGASVLDREGYAPPQRGAYPA